MDTIAMVKTDKTKYLYEGQSFNIKQIYSKSWKRRGLSIYLLSADVNLKKDGKTLPARIVCVRNKSNRKNWLALISMDRNLSEEKIICIYGNRWKKMLISAFFLSRKDVLVFLNHQHI